MPPIRRRSSSIYGTSTTKIPIYSLSSGVSTQAPSKRLPLEAEAIDNALLSLERSFEKRAGFEVVKQNGFIASNQINLGNRLDLFKLNKDPSIVTDIYWTWFTINEDNRFLIGIDYKAKAENSILFYVFKINKDNWEDVTPTSNTDQTEQNTTIVSETTRKYITYGNEDYKAIDVLKVTTLGSSLIVLNNKVKAGFTSGSDGLKVGLDGKSTTSIDKEGQKVTYYTAASIMGSTGNLERLTVTSDIAKVGYDDFYLSTTGQAISSLQSITISLNIDSRIVSDGSNVVINALSGGNYLTGQYLNGVVNKLYNSDLNTTAFDDTPAAFKNTLTSISKDGTANPAYNTLINSIVSIVVGSNFFPTSSNYGTGILVYKSKEEWFYGYIQSSSTQTNAIVKITNVSETWKNNTSSFSTTSINVALECTTINIVASTTALAANTNAITDWRIWFGSYIPVEDFKYKDPTTPWLGQSFNDFSEIRFPPEPYEIFTNNSSLIPSGEVIDQTAREMLSSLYDSSHPLISQINASGAYPSMFGLGKIYYTAGPYLTQTSGYYRVINFPETQTYKLNSSFIKGTGRPYTQKIRSPDICSVIDKTRMPQKLSFDASPEGINKDWYFGPIKWKERTNGDRTNNPGPSVFLNSEKTEARHININTITTYRDRLYFSSGDVVFSSQLGVYDDLFLQDPSNIVSSDPIDIRASSKSYAEIVALTPFSDFLFVNTKADIQFELRGSENQITPLTAQITPTAFYSTARLTEPLLMGSLIYFFDNSRLYMYLAQQGTSLSTAEEVSSHCFGYLPENFRATCTAPANNSIIFVDDDKPNYLYIYTNRFSGDKILQNAFYRYILNENDIIESTQVYDNYLYIVVKRINTTTFKNEYYILKSYLGKQNTSIPKLDNLFEFTIQNNNNTIYNSLTNETTFKLVFPYLVNLDNLYIVTSSNDLSWGEDKFTVLKPIKILKYSTGVGCEIVVKGNYLFNGRKIYIGTSFLMNVELSSQFVRDQNNNIMNGTLNLKSLILRHSDTGNYDVVATRKNKSTLISKFSPILSDINSDTLSIENIQKSGEFTAKILGYSDSTNIKIISEYPTPVNIINMEFRGKFKQKNNSFNT